MNWKLLPAIMRPRRSKSGTRRRDSSVKLPRWVWLLLILWSVSAAIVIGVVLGHQCLSTMLFAHAVLVGFKERATFLLEVAIFILKHVLEHF